MILITFLNLHTPQAAGTLAIELDSDGSPGATRAAGGVVVGAVIDGIEFLQDAKGKSWGVYVFVPC